MFRGLVFVLIISITIAGCTSSKVSDEITSKQVVQPVAQAITDERKPTHEEIVAANKEKLRISRMRLEESRIKQQRKRDAIKRERIKKAHEILSNLEKSKTNEGSYPKVTAALIKSLHNPRSFEHIKTTASVVSTFNSAKIVITIHYRATNAFGGLVKQSTRIEYDYNGNLISVK